MHGSGGHANDHATHALQRVLYRPWLYRPWASFASSQAALHTLPFSFCGASRGRFRQRQLLPCIVLNPLVHVFLDVGVPAVLIQIEDNASGAKHDNIAVSL